MTTPNISYDKGAAKRIVRAGFNALVEFDSMGESSVPWANSAPNSPGLV
jgi:hypothetical protein